MRTSNPLLGRPLRRNARHTLASYVAPVVAAVAVGLLVRVPAKAAYPPSAEGGRVAVATDHAEATNAALTTLSAGGNAVDAAIAAALTLGVVSPNASGLGGGGFALVWSAKEGKAIALDFRETAPAKTDGQVLFERSTRPDHEDPMKRGAAVGVPGEPAGLEWLSRRYGKLTLLQDATPAVTVATRGFLASKHLTDTTRAVGRRLSVSPELSQVFLPGGLPLAHRVLVQRPELARSILRFGQHGARPFYEGPVAEKIVHAAQAVGGQIEPRDLGAYQPKERKPLIRTIDGRTVVTMPAPSAGGLMLAEVLSMYGASGSSPLKAMGFGTSGYLHTLAEAMRGAVADRVRLVGDPDADPSVDAAVEQALDPRQMAARRARIQPSQTHAAPEFRTRESGTSHIVVADAEGNVVTLTTTINDPFGARIVAGDTGILLNNQLDDFSSPTDIRGFGVVGLGPNRPRAGARPVSSMAPAIVLERGAPILALGGAGGPYMATAVTQAAVARLVFDLDPSVCVAAPRVHVNGSSQDLFVEPEITDDLRAALRARGEGPKEDRIAHGAVQMIAWDRSRPIPRVYAASDPRKDGLSAAQ